MACEKLFLIEKNPYAGEFCVFGSLGGNTLDATDVKLRIIERDATGYRELVSTRGNILIGVRNVILTYDDMWGLLRQEKKLSLVVRRRGKQDEAIPVTLFGKSRNMVLVKEDVRANPHPVVKSYFDSANSWRRFHIPPLPKKDVDSIEVINFETEFLSSVERAVEKLKTLRYTDDWQVFLIFIFLARFSTAQPETPPTAWTVVPEEIGENTKDKFSLSSLSSSLASTPTNVVAIAFASLSALGVLGFFAYYFMSFKKNKKIV